MSSGTRSNKGKAEEAATTLSITAAEVEVIVQKAVSLAVKEMQELLNNKLEDLSGRILVVETRLVELEERLTNVENNSSATSVQSQVQAAKELSSELVAVRSETRESLLMSNDKNSIAAETT